MLSPHRLQTPHVPEQLTPDRLYDLLHPGAEVYAPGCGGHSALFERWLRDAPERSDGVRYTGIHIPTVNRFDFAGLHPHARMRNIFLGMDWRAAWERDAFDYLPISYSAAWQWLSEEARFDVALLQVAPPDAQGDCSLGIGCDFSPAAWPNARTVVAQVNPLMPRTRGPSIPWSRIDFATEAATPLLESPDPAADPVLDQVAANIAAVIPDGASVQLGLGKLQSAVLRELRGHRGLRIHSGMVSDGLLPLLDSGALDTAADAVTAGVALGSAALYDVIADRVAFREVGHTHDGGVLRSLPRLHAVNSALSVDLFGQVNGDVLGGKLISGLGGLPDFLRGARQSTGGRGIVALAALTGKGQSRIVPSLGEGPASLPRIDADVVVTEFGHADLRYLDTRGRARALIAIAAPQHREWLEQEWHKIAARL